MVFARAADLAERAENARLEGSSLTSLWMITEHSYTILHTPYCDPLVATAMFLDAIL